MPSKEEIFAKLLYLINAPAQRLVTAIGAVGRNLAVVIDQGVKENKFKAKGRAKSSKAAIFEKELRKWRTSTQLRIRFKA
jgi:large subunit ribosomal protein L10